MARLLVLVGIFIVSFSAGIRADSSGGAAQNSTGTTLPADSDWSVTEIGSDHRVWQSTSYETRPDGSVISHLHQYTELASGMYYQTNGHWAEAKEEIEGFAGGAIARQGQYQVIFANNLNSAGAIDMQTTDGKRLRSSILGLAYYDRSTSNTVMIAQVQDCQGQFLSANQVIYTNAFEGVLADVRYTYKRGSFEQDVILREQPPAPASLGLNPATTEIEVVTELVEPPAASVYDPGDDDSGMEGDEDIGWGATRTSAGGRRGHRLGGDGPRVRQGL